MGHKSSNHNIGAKRSASSQADISSSRLNKHSSITNDIEAPRPKRSCATKTISYYNPFEVETPSFFEPAPSSQAPQTRKHDKSSTSIFNPRARKQIEPPASSYNHQENFPISSKRILRTRKIVNYTEQLVIPVTPIIKRREDATVQSELPRRGKLSKTSTKIIEESDSEEEGIENEKRKNTTTGRGSLNNEDNGHSSEEDSHSSEDDYGEEKDNGNSEEVKENPDLSLLNIPVRKYSLRPRAQPNSSKDSSKSSIFVPEKLKKPLKSTRNYKDSSDSDQSDFMSQLDYNKKEFSSQSPEPELNNETNSRYQTRGASKNYKKFYNIKNKLKAHSSPVNPRKSKRILIKATSASKYNFRQRDSKALKIMQIQSQGFTVDRKAYSLDPLNADFKDIIEEKLMLNKNPNVDEQKAFEFLPLNLHDVLDFRPDIHVPAEMIKPYIPFLKGFSAIGGLSTQIDALKKDIFLPIKYPEFAKTFGLSLSRGIIFHGPPGTGKTMTAKALVHECSMNSNPIAFFHVNANDMLSKWVGKSEAKIKSLFQTARQWQPSVIFIDEIDGLTPKRTSSDRHSASLVSTLLSQMDGLDNSGQVVVIGATNRVYAIDPALRRAGRLEKELLFPLPDYATRLAILEKSSFVWPNPPSGSLLSNLAVQTNGYCGADLVSLCSNAVKNALFRACPKARYSEITSDVIIQNVIVEEKDFAEVTLKFTPSIQHQFEFSFKPLEAPLDILFGKHIDSILNQIKPTDVSPLGLLPIHKPKTFILNGNSPITSSHMLSAILHGLDGFNLTKLDLPALIASDDLYNLKELTLKLNAAKKKGQRTVVVLPFADNLLKSMPRETAQTLSKAMHEPGPIGRVTFLLTTQTLSPEIKSLFPERTKYAQSLQIDKPFGDALDRLKDAYPLGFRWLTLKLEQNTENFPNGLFDLKTDAFLQMPLDGLHGLSSSNSPIHPVTTISDSLPNFFHSDQLQGEEEWQL